MASVTLDIPDDLLMKWQSQNQDVERELLLAAAFSLCGAGGLSTSQAARLAGMTYGEFLEAAARAKVMLYPVDVDELKEEIGRGFTLGRQRIADHSACQGRAP
jgi:predicted HTH domain antitoxin